MKLYIFNEIKITRLSSVESQSKKVVVVVVVVVIVVVGLVVGLVVGVVVVIILRQRHLLLKFGQNWGQ